MLSMKMRLRLITRGIMKLKLNGKYQLRKLKKIMKLTRLNLIVLITTMRFIRLNMSST